jgi:hypothetical protein
MLFGDKAQALPYIQKKTAAEATVLFNFIAFFVTFVAFL